MILGHLLKMTKNSVKREKVKLLAEDMVSCNWVLIEADTFKSGSILIN